MGSGDQSVRRQTRLSGPVRSKLFVPATRPEFFDKALASDADSISLDLEDAVQANRKAEARAAAADFLDRVNGTGHGKVILVRLNGLASGHFDADLAAVVRPGLDLINLPKAESPDEIRVVAEAVARIERERGLSRPVGILANIETPRALRRAAEIACAHSRVVGLQLGFGDLFEPLGMDRAEKSALDSIRVAVRLAAGEAGISAYDAAYPNVADPEGYRAEAETAYRLGYAGKSCIHPSQIALANAAFRPRDSEIAHAQRVVSAAREAAEKGIGAFMVDGRMVDGPLIPRAEAIVRLAQRLGLLAG
jgi:citrate lyase beta subunit